MAGRRTYFHVRRVLGFSRADFDGLPWCDQQMYLEQLAGWLEAPGAADDTSDPNDLAAQGFAVETA